MRDFFLETLRERNCFYSYMRGVRTPQHMQLDTSFVVNKKEGIYTPSLFSFQGGNKINKSTKKGGFMSLCKVRCSLQLDSSEGDGPVCHLPICPERFAMTAIINNMSGFSAKRQLPLTDLPSCRTQCCTVEGNLKKRDKSKSKEVVDGDDILKVGHHSHDRISWLLGHGG